MKFNLSQGLISKTNNSTIYGLMLPSGTVEVLMLDTVYSHRECYFVGETTNTIAVLSSIFNPLHVCGDILITMHEMGYDLSSKNDSKKAKNEKEKILTEYHKLIESKPELFSSDDMDIVNEFSDGLPLFTNKESIMEFVNTNKSSLDNGIKIKGFNRDLIIQDSKVGTQNAGTLFGKIGKMAGEEGLTEVFYQDITNFIFTPATAFARGQFQIVVKGQERKDTGLLSSSKGKNDPFTIYLKQGSNDIFQSAKKIVDYFLELNKTGGQQQTIIQTNAPDIPEQIRKLSELKDQGILTEEEFGKKKEELLAKI